MKGPRSTYTQSRGMKDGTTRYVTGAPCLVKDPRGCAIAPSERSRLMTGNTFDFTTTNARADFAVSPVISEILLVAVAVILVAVIAVLFSGALDFVEVKEATPEILKIMSISHTNDNGKLTYASSVTLRNVGFVEIQNSDHGIHLYVNDVKKNAVIETLQGHDFISTHHNGVRYLKGQGPIGKTWAPAEFGTVDFSEYTIKPKDLVRIEVYNTTTEDIVSISEMRAPAIFD